MHLLVKSCTLLIICAVQLACAKDALKDSSFYKTAYESKAALAHDKSIFTQGFIMRDGMVWESSGLYGKSFLVRWRFPSGKVVQRKELDKKIFAEGITILNNKLYMLTWKAGKGYVFNPDTLEEIGQFQYEGQGWGLTTDGKQLIMSDGSDMLRFIDPDSFEVTDTKRVRIVDQSVYSINELEWVNGKIWANVFQTDFIIVIDPETGLVEERLFLQNLRPPRRGFSLPGVLNGIAYDEKQKRLFITGKHWPVMHELEAVEANKETNQ